MSQVGFWHRLGAALDARGRVGIVSILKVEGSSPREVGARMIVHQSGDFFGTIGGGAFEWQALALAHDLISRGSATFITRSFSLGPELGQCCGGRVILGFEVLTSAQLESVQRFAELENEGSVFFTRSKTIEGEVLFREIVEDADTPGFDHDILIERFGRDSTPLYLFGAGHVAKALVLALATLPFEVTWIDERADIFPSVMPQNVRGVSPENVVELAKNVPDRAYVLIMTHSHGLDLEILSAVLQRETLGYIGLIGSDTKRARFESQLEKIGLRDAAKKRLICPIGIAGIKGKSPAQIALAVAAELLIFRDRLVG